MNITFSLMNILGCKGNEVESFFFLYCATDSTAINMEHYVAITFEVSTIFVHLKDLQFLIITFHSNNFSFGYF